MTYDAVVFDLGGVILGSPLRAFTAYEQSLGLAPGFLGRVIGHRGEHGAWARLERGELDMNAFYAAFETEVAEAGARISAAELMDRIADGSPLLEPMVEGVRRLRRAHLRVAALTNNWLSPDQGQKMDRLRPEFDVFVESARVGMRKPDPRIYQLACERLGVEAARAVFLDDIGVNLKAARALGMTTIKVVEPLQALSELGHLLGLSLCDAD